MGQGKNKQRRRQRSKQRREDKKRQKQRELEKQGVLRMLQENIDYQRAQAQEKG